MNLIQNLIYFNLRLNWARENRKTNLLRKARLDYIFLSQLARNKRIQTHSHTFSFHFILITKTPYCHRLLHKKKKNLKIVKKENKPHNKIVEHIKKKLDLCLQLDLLFVTDNWTLCVSRTWVPQQTENLRLVCKQHLPSSL